jgi:hypothetical protein
MESIIMVKKSKKNQSALKKGAFSFITGDAFVHT